MNVLAFSAAAKHPLGIISRIANSAPSHIVLGGLRFISNTSPVPHPSTSSFRTVPSPASWKDSPRRPLTQQYRSNAIRFGSRHHMSDKASSNENVKAHVPKPTDTLSPSPEAPPSPSTETASNGAQARSLLSHLVYPFALFSNVQRSRPYTTQFITSLIIYAFADLIAQHFQTVPDEPYSPARTLRMMAIGGVASSPAYWWFGFLGRNFNYASLPLSLAVKVVVQQIVFSPIFNFYFFSMQAILEGKESREVVERVRHALPESLLNSVKLWPAVTALNFWLVEARFRMFVAMLVAVGWQGYLSFLNSREARREEVEMGAEEKKTGLEERGTVNATMA